jgi:shikimate kinase
MPVADIFASQGEAAFRAREKRLLAQVLEPGVVAALGGGAVADDDSWSLVRSRAFSVYLEVPFEALWARIHDRPGRPLAAGRSRHEIELLFEARRAHYEQAQVSVRGDRSVEVVAEEVLQLWFA